MADNLKKTFTIEIQGVKESVTNLESLESILDKMEKQVESINKNGGFSVISKEQNKNTKEAIDLAKAEEIAQGKTVSSYKEKQKAMSALGKEIKAMVASDDESIRKQQELINQYNGLNDQLKRFDASMGNHQRNVGDYRGALREATQQIKEMQGEMAQMLLNGVDKADPKFVELAKKAGNLQDAIGDARQEVSRFASDTKKLDDVINIAQSATAAFTLYKGAMSAFGVETEGAVEAIQKLQGAMAVLQSLQQLQDSLKQNSATARLFNNSLGLLTKGMQGASLGAKALRISLASIGIGLIIGLVAALVEHWEDLVGWFEKTFPAVKKVGGVLNGLKATIVGVGKAILNWLVNPIETFVKAAKKLFEGDFNGAVQAITDGIKNQFQGTADAFKQGFQEQVERGLDEITAKNAEETNKITQQQLKELKIQERNNKTYSKKYIDLQKKDFEERRKAARGNQEELNKIKLEEMQFFADVEDKKTAAAKQGASERAKAAKDAAKAATDAAKKEAEEYKNLITARRALRDEIINNDLLDLRNQERLQQDRLEAYDAGPIEKYNAELEKLRNIQSEIFTKETQQTVVQIGDYLEDNIKTIKKTSSEWQEYISNIKSASDITLQLTETETNNLLAQWQKYEALRLKAEDESNAEYIDNRKKAFAVIKNEFSDWADDFNREYNKLINRVKDSPLEKPVRDKVFGIIDKKETLKNLEILKTQWDKTYIQLSGIISKDEARWNEYLQEVEKIYGKDSSAFKKAQKEKEDALKPLREKLLEVAKRANNPTSTETDYTGDNQAGASTKAKRTLWNKDNDLLKNMSDLFQTMDEMVLGPAMDTFSMYMDFAIEETQAKLDIVQGLHDKAMEDVESSVDKIKELNDSLKDSSNSNLEMTKQQLADEQLLYAQRLAEEQKLAQQERDLQNKANEQEYQSRMMELRYQLFLGIANTAQGVTKTLAEWPFPISAVFAGMQAALGAVQTAIIAKQLASFPKPRKLADGGLLEGPSHAHGGIPVGNTGIEVEGQEYVVNKRSTKRYLPLLEAINNDGRKKTPDAYIKKYADGGRLNFENIDTNLRQNADTNRLLNAIDNIEFSPTVSVVDFERVQTRLTKVRSLAGR